MASDSLLSSSWNAIGDSILQQSRESMASETKVDRGLQHLGFRISTERFLLPVTHVREIIMLPTVTFVPRGPLAVEGILALRGEIMPVLNLRRLWGMEKGGPSNHTRVVILQVSEAGFGFIVDEITDFISLEPHQIEAVPSNFFSAEYSILEGVAKSGERVRGIVSVERMLRLLPISDFEFGESNENSEDVA